MSDDSTNDNLLMHVILLNIPHKIIGPITLIEFSKRYAAQIVRIIQSIPSEIIDYPSDMITVLAKDLNWEYHVGKFDEYSSSKINLKFKVLINFYKL